jgi:hypothetical protein
VHYWWFSLNERSRARQARKREAEYRRSEARGAANDKADAR